MFFGFLDVFLEVSILGMVLREVPCCDTTFLDTSRGI